MRKFSSILFFLTLALCISNAYSQQYAASKMVTEGDKIIKEVSFLEATNQSLPTEFTSMNLDIIWHKPETYAVGEQGYYSKLTEKSFINWALNDKRVTQYGNTTTPVWEFPTNAGFPKSYSNKNGSLYLVLNGNELYALDPANGSVVWQKTFSESVSYAAAYPDGTGFYCGVGDYPNEYTVYSFLTSSQTPVWEFTVPNGVVAIAMPEDHSVVAVCVSYPTNQAKIVNPADGEVKQNLYYYNNTPTQAPAFSADGEYFVFADFDGMGRVYKKNGANYELHWQASIKKAGATFAWGCGQTISADGSTIAFGTLDFIPAGSGYDFDGTIYVYNSSSNTPLWTKTNIGDEVCYISMTDNGSIFACASWGPLNHSTPDLYIFNKESSDPISTLNTPGSLYYVEIAPDGSKGIATGKGIHARDMGWGGNAYFFNILVPEPTFGEITGKVTLVSSQEHSGAQVTIVELPSFTTLSDAAGDFKFENVPTGTYSLTASKTGYVSKTIENVIVTDGNTTAVEFGLEPKTFIITATCTDGGEIEPSGEVVVKEGENQKFMITAAITLPKHDYRCFIEDILIDNVSIGPFNNLQEKEYIFENVTGSHTIHAVFYCEVSVVETERAPSLQIIPNPANEFIELQVTGYELQIGNIEFYNAFGQLVKNVPFVDEEMQRISIADLAKGLYVVKVGDLVQRLVKF